VESHNVSHQSEHFNTQGHIFAIIGKLPQKCFDIEEGPNYFRIQVRRQHLKINIRKRFCNNVKKKVAFDKIKEEQACLIAQYC
jgi:hypothetical protein